MNVVFAGEVRVDWLCWRERYFAKRPIITPASINYYYYNLKYNRIGPSYNMGD